MRGGQLRDKELAMKSDARTVDEYLGELDPVRREALAKMRALVLETVSDAVETMQYKMPTFEYQGGMLCALASQKRYMSLYIEPQVVEWHRDELGGLSVGKSCIRFRNIEQLPLGVVRAMLEETAQRLRDGAG
jgi:uncharacterized protein YdhG (YjbR/CyaY superfamily)